MKRIRGRVVNKQDVNGFFPKFTLEPYRSLEPLKHVIASPAALDGVDSSEDVYEPIETGLGVVSDTMYVRTVDTTYVFHFSVEQDITWGSWFVAFKDPVTMGGDRV